MPKTSDMSKSRGHTSDAEVRKQMEAEPERTVAQRRAEIACERGHVSDREIEKQMELERENA